MRVYRICERCEAEFLTAEARIEQGKARFCSLECRHAVPLDACKFFGPYLTHLQARILGARFYKGRDCDQAHMELRYTSTTQCVRCTKIRAMATPKKKRDPDRAKWDRIKAVYGLDRDSFAAIKDKQEGACAICADHLSEKIIHIDHCHDTGKVRGLLCGPCNQGIGLLKEDPVRMLRAIKYVEYHRAGDLAA